MQIKIGTVIKELRKRDGRTQEEIASKLGVTSQAVSRWEADGGYPDMEIIPSIAGLFGVSIDALFGYDGIDRKKRIDDILSEVWDMVKRNISDAEIAVLIRNAAAEFPSEERILVELAETLSRQGWSERGARAYTSDGDEYTHNDSEWNKDNLFWKESIKLFTNLLENSRDNKILTRSKQGLINLYRVIGRYDKAVEIAETFPELYVSREIMLYKGTDGEEMCKYAQDALMKLLSELKDALTYVIISRQPINSENYLSDIERRIEKINGIVKLYELIYDDENMGFYHNTVCEMYLWLASMYCDVYSRTGGENGDKNSYLDLSFDCLDKALKNAKRFDKLIATGEHKYTAFLVNLAVTDTNKWTASVPTAKNIMNHWQLFDHIKKVLEKDERWQIWVEKATI